ncbi:MAG: OmpA family protein [Alphaproteobacteria bacterium]
MRYRRGVLAASVVAMAGGLAACTAPHSSGDPQGTPPATVLTPASAAAPAAQAETAAPKDLRLYFDSGRSALRADSRAALDQAARLFREGDPLVMIVTGLSDTTGDPRRNLLLSQERAGNVAKGLMDRGIPATRLQVVAKGESELPVKTGDNVAQAENRAVIITWR